jgi:hypothetical protein
MTAKPGYAEATYHHPVLGQAAADKFFGLLAGDYRAIKEYMT